MPHPFPRRHPVAAHRAFSLILSLTVMAMLLILCVGAAALLSMELRVAQASVTMTRARLNAMIGARVAFGELQRLMGPDQRVSATADILGDPDTTDPTRASAYNAPGKGMIVHPRWVGVWNTGKTDDDNAPVGAIAAQTKKVIYRTADGVLKDSRFSTTPAGFAGRDAWTDARAGTTMARSGRRMLGWLVSGNEALPHTDSTAPSPFTPIDATKDIVALGVGTLGKLFDTSRTDTDMLGSRVRTVDVPDATGSSSGDYAYWVADEGLKARINIRDKFEAAGILPDGSSPGSGGLARLLVSQRQHIDPLSGISPIPGAPALPDMNYTSGKNWDEAHSFDDLALADNPSAPSSDRYSADRYKPYYFNDFGFVSAGVDCDVENGGLKKDLTYYFNKRADVADYGGVHGSGIQGSSAMLPVDDPASGSTEPALTPVFPKFSLLNNWWTNAPGYAATSNNTPVAPLAPASANASYTQISNLNGASPSDPLFTVPVPMPGPTAVNAPLSPVVTKMAMYFKPVYDDSSGSASSYQARILVYPQVVIWNPYPVAIRLSAPTIEWLNDWCVYANIAPTPSSGSVTYIATRPHLTYKLPAVTLKPGQSVSFVADTGANTFPSGSIQPGVAFAARTITMKTGLPGAANYYIDAIAANGWGTTLVSAPVSTPVAGVSVGYGTGNFAPGSFDERIMATDQVLLREGGQTLSHLKMDRHNTAAAKMVITDGRHYALKPMTDQWGTGTLLRTLAAETSAPTPVSSMFMVGFRAKRMDNTEFSDTGAGGLRGLTVNPIVDMNIRATRQTRSPFDAQDMITPQSTQKKVTNVTLTFNYVGQYLGGIWTEDWSSPQDMSDQGPGAFDKLVPFYQSSKGKSAPQYPGCIPFDLPYRDVGLVSLAQLDGAPLNPFGYGPSMPFASGRMPVADIASLTDSSGLSSAVATSRWSTIAQWGSFGQEQLRKVSAIGAATTDIFDIAYELNHAMWDAYRISGIASSNTGWNVGSGAWQNPAPTAGNFGITLPSSRYTPTPDGFPAPTGFFATPAYGLYHPSYTLMQKGAFNVNSTSRLAWISLLTSCRGLPVPTASGTIANNNATPFLRLLRPKGGPVGPGGSFTENMWSGYRTLSDTEIRTLADKIVAEVKKRGPFLSLSDFVNRRLKTPSGGDYADWTNRECDYLGTLEAAIVNAGLNDTTASDSPMDRYTKDTFIGNPLLAQQTGRKPAHRSRHTVAGAPGYLQQSDILRSIGNALTARSDTFTVRARGEYNGAVAWVEVLVQRYPEPLVPGSGTSLPINPKAIQAGSAYAGNQFFGRRMRIVSSRWLDPQTI